MAEPVTASDVEDVLSSIRRLVGETKRSEHNEIRAEKENMFVLTPQLRVRSDSDVLRLTPEQEVPQAADIDGFEEPPLEAFAVVQEAPDLSAQPPEAGYPTVEVERTSEAEFMELSAKIAALETAIAKTADQWEPDEVGDDAYAGTQPPAMEWRDGVELDGTGQPMAEAPDAEPEPAQTSAEDRLETAFEEQLLDEETLRELVAEIVRDELQGELGERITRNVRKLVRREVHRALIAFRA